MPVARRACGLLVVLATGACVPDRADTRREAFLEIVAAEDTRASGGADLALLREAAGWSDPFLRAAAVRALGRLERPELLADILEHLDDLDPAVRAEAANAVAQALHRGPGDEGLEPLLRRAEAERDPFVRGVVGHALGRLTVVGDDLSRVERALLGLTREGAGDAPPETLVGVLLGLDDLTRRSGRERPLDGATAARSWELYFSEAAAGSGDGARMRELILSSLGQGGHVDALPAIPALRDAESTVRLRMVRLGAALPPDRRGELLRTALDDSVVAVRVEAVRVLAAGALDAPSCERISEAAAPGQPTMLRLVALEALAEPCPDRSAQVRLLREAVAELSADTDAWHEPTRALVSLARLDPAAARERLGRFVTHASPFARAHAARAAGAAEDRTALEALARDPHPNVRTAALEELFGLRGHAEDDLLRGQLGSDDPQLVLTVARLLRGSPGGEAVAHDALSALERLSATGRETLRDPRLALLELIAEMGTPGLAPRLEAYLTDHDARVAESAAEILGGWTGRPVRARPEPARRLPLPGPAELAELERTSVLLHMRRGGTIEIALLPLLATTNAWRFARLVREGYFDGLTFHRVAPNFVIQGGSPGANEYAGDGPYTRDEVGLESHWRGAVGLSTRGHDTGDGQIFVDLVSNLRLDHEYTIFGVVTSGLELVDGVLEGDVIERAELRTAGPR